MYVAEHPERVRRRLVPDAVQVQIVLGSLLGRARIEGAAGERRMRVAHGVADAEYAWWKYDRLGALTADPPVVRGDEIAFATIAHPLFDELAPFFVTRRGARTVHALLAPLGLAVWMSDRGRLRLRAELFVPTRRGFAITADALALTADALALTA
ncbi:MAG TPA: hypothetical protein VFC31_12365 [Candidatus Limnocylindria bacterium]|nr:hypothetical protein [Candidatus Limnocylindria bacterium]